VNVRIGRYEVIDEIGAGGMGRVRLARDGGGRLVVLKNALRDDDDDDERLRDEARVGLRLKHPSLVETLDLFEVKDSEGRSRPFLVTAYVPGVSLIDLRRHGPVEPAVVCRLARQIAEALDALHDARGDDGRALGVLHRDVTAGNCLVGHDGRARLIDLGISRSAESQALRTGTGLLRGTLRYLAPELFDGGAYSVQSDIWALGVVMWETLLGRSAITGSDAVAVGRICSGNLMVLEDDEQIDPRLTRAFGQLLKKNARDRPRRAREAAALFAMLEKDLGAGLEVDALTRAAVWRAVDGDDIRQDKTSSVVESAARTFAGDRTSSPPLPPLAALPKTVVEGPGEGSPTDARMPAKTPSQAIADYAASLLSMEKALAQAWERSSAAVSGTLAGLPVVTGPAVEEDVNEGGLPEFQFPGALPLPPLTPLSIATPRRAPPVPADEDDTAF
jgi:serine/threonine-protein kinase